MTAHLRSVIGPFVMACVVGAAIGTPIAQSPARRPNQSDGYTLRKLFAERHVDEQAPPGIDLDRGISNFGLGNDDQVFAVGFYWQDELVKNRLPANVQLLLLDKASHRWVARTVDGGNLPGTDETPEGVGLGSIMGIDHNSRYVAVVAHNNPSAGTALVLTRALEPIAAIYGFPQFSTTTNAFIYVRSQVHFAPTHWLELYVYDPASGVDRQFYPVRPYDRPRTAFMAKMTKAYAAAGRAWCAENNHHCDPELFDSELIGRAAVNRETDSAAFLVRFGNEPGWGRPGPDSKVPPERVVVTCRHLSKPADITCSEAPLADVQKKHPGMPVERLLEIAAR